LISRKKPLKPNLPQSEQIKGSNQVSLKTTVANTVTLLEVRELIKEKSVRELPGIVPFTVDEFFMTQSVAKWDNICLDAFGKVEARVIKVVKESCTEFFRRFKSSGFEGAVLLIPSLA
jgi:hypothetical protein